MIYVVTSILDGFDNLRPPVAIGETFVKHICFTNIPNLPRVTPWEYRPAYIAGKPCRSSRVPKILAHRILPRDAEFSIYHDGNFVLKLDAFQIIQELLKDGKQWAVHRHPERGCLYKEAEIILTHQSMEGWRALKPYAVAEVSEQVAKYRATNFPESYGLWANGFIVRRHTPEVARLNELWWGEFKNGSERDQLSFPVALREAGMEIKTIDANIYKSPYIGYRWHAAFKNHEDNPDFWPERDAVRANLQALKELTGSDSGIAFQSY